MKLFGAVKKLRALDVDLEIPRPFFILVRYGGAEFGALWGPWNRLAAAERPHLQFIPFRRLFPSCFLPYNFLCMARDPPASPEFPLPYYGKTQPLQEREKANIAKEQDSTKEGWSCNRLHKSKLDRQLFRNSNMTRDIPHQACTGNPPDMYMHRNSPTDNLQTKPRSYIPPTAQNSPLDRRICQQPSTHPPRPPKNPFPQAPAPNSPKPPLLPLPVLISIKPA